LWYQKGELEKTRFYNDKLKPVLGSYIISRNPVPELKPEEQEEGINILTVGFDQSRLEAVIKPFRNQHP
jgi:hypothetical protein